MIELKPTNAGCRLTVKVSPNASRDAITGTHGDALKIAVKAQPQKGKANHAVIKLLADVLDVSPAQIEIVRGHTATLKTLVIAGQTPGQIAAKLAHRID